MNEELTDEFAFLGGNAEQAGVVDPLPAVERIQAGPTSALRWGTTPPMDRCLRDHRTDHIDPRR